MSPSSSDKRPKLGIALGGGSAHGLAHIGVLRALEEQGLVPDVVAGTSIGAVIGAAYVFGKLAEVEAAARRVNWLEVFRLTDIQFGKNGLLGGYAIVREIRNYLGDATFADASRPFAVVTADLVRDEEVVLRSGPVADAIRASISIPGIFSPVARDGRLLVDGGLKNPVPISICRELGADVVIAVDVSGDRLAQGGLTGDANREAFRPGMVEVLITTMAMVMKQLAHARFLTNPPDVLIVPKVGHIRPYAFNRAPELIEAGRAAAVDAIADIEAHIDDAREARPEKEG